MVRWFPALYRGECTACGKKISQGDNIGYVDGEIVGLECCAGAGLRTLTNVMPYGKTATDKCEKCFIIHATGQTQCE